MHALLKGFMMEKLENNLDTEKKLTFYIIKGGCNNFKYMEN